MTRSALFVTPGFLLVGAFLLWPLAWIGMVSFTVWDGYDRIQWAGISTWTSLLSDPVFQSALEHSLLWIVLSATVPVVLGFALAIGFLKSGPLGGIGRAISIVPLLLPSVVVAVMWQILYNPSYGPIDGIITSLGWAGTPPDWLGSPNLAFWSLTLVALWASVGISVLIFTAALKAIDPAYFDLLRIEGGGFRHEVTSVLLPASRRSIGLTVILTVVVTSQVFDLLYIMTNGGPAGSTIMLPFDVYLRSFTGLQNVSQGVAESAIEVAIGLLLAALALTVSGRHSEMAGDSTGMDGRKSPWAIIVAAVACVALVLPFAWDLLAAFSEGRAAALHPLTFRWPPSFSAFETAWNSGIGSGLLQSTIIALIVVTATLVLAVPAAFVLSQRRLNPYVRGIALTVLVVALLQPGEGLIIPLFYSLQQLGLGNSVFGLILVEIAKELPFAMLLLWIAIVALPLDVTTAGEIDAGRGFHQLTRIVAPMITPALAAMSVWVFVSSWSEFTLPTILLNNSTVETAPMALRAFAGTHDTEFNLLAAGSLLIILPVLIVLGFAYGPAARGLRATGRALAV